MLPNLKKSIPHYDLLLTSILLPRHWENYWNMIMQVRTFEDFQFLFPTADHTTGLKIANKQGLSMDELGVMIGHIPYGVLITFENH